MHIACRYKVIIYVYCKILLKDHSDQDVIYVLSISLPRDTFDELATVSYFSFACQTIKVVMQVIYRWRAKILLDSFFQFPFQQLCVDIKDFCIKDFKMFILLESHHLFNMTTSLGRCGERPKWIYRILRPISCSKGAIRK
jgi:hypothetical protein